MEVRLEYDPRQEMVSRMVTRYSNSVSQISINTIHSVLHDLLPHTML
jgi:hypothetical protein